MLKKQLRRLGGHGSSDEVDRLKALLNNLEQENDALRSNLQQIGKLLLIYHRKQSVFNNVMQKFPLLHEINEINENSDDIQENMILNIMENNNANFVHSAPNPVTTPLTIADNNNNNQQFFVGVAASDRGVATGVGVVADRNDGRYPFPQQQQQQQQQQYHQEKQGPVMQHAKLDERKSSNNSAQTQNTTESRDRRGNKRKYSSEDEDHERQIYKNENINNINNNYNIYNDESNDNINENNNESNDKKENKNNKRPTHHRKGSRPPSIHVPSAYPETHVINRPSGTNSGGSGSGGNTARSSGDGKTPWQKANYALNHVDVDLPDVLCVVCV